MAVTYYDDGGFVAMHKLCSDGHWYYLMARRIRVVKEENLVDSDPDCFETAHKVTLLKSLVRDVLSSEAKPEHILSFVVNTQYDTILSLREALRVLNETLSAITLGLAFENDHKSYQVNFPQSLAKLL